jgi:hypothetical protein
MLSDTSRFTTFFLKTKPNISGRKTPGSIRGSPPPLLYNNCGGELRVKLWVWRPEMWAQDTVTLKIRNPWLVHLPEEGP